MLGIFVDIVDSVRSFCAGCLSGGFCLLLMDSPGGFLGYRTGCMFGSERT